MVEFISLIKKIREEILENERKKGEAMKKMSLGDDFWDQLKVIEKNSPKSFLMVVNIIVMIIIIKQENQTSTSKINPNLHTMKINLKHIWVKKTIKN